MPTYTFRDDTTGDEWTEMLTMSEREAFLTENPHVTQVPKAMNIVAGVMGGLRSDKGWQENLSRISEAHPMSNLAGEYGDKSSKTVKTRKAVEKWRTKRAAVEGRDALGLKSSAPTWKSKDV